MRRIRPLLAALAGLGLLASTSGCDWPQGTRYVNQVFSQTDVTENVVYGRATNYQGQQIDLRLDIYQPRGDTEAKRPAVVWMFGGAWVAGNKDQMDSYAQDSARRGYVGVTIDYRTGPAGTNVADLAGNAYDDSVAAIQWLKDNAATYRIDPDAIVAGGVSAGAINAMHLLYMPGERGPATSPVAGGISISGLSFSPATGGEPRSIMHHGSVDPIVPFANGRNLCNQANEVGDRCRFEVYEGAGHEIGFTQAAVIRDRSHDWLYEEVLIPRGYAAAGG